MIDPAIPKSAIRVPSSAFSGAGPKSLSPLALALRRFRRNRLALAGLVILAMIVSMCLAGLLWQAVAVARGAPEPYRTPLAGVHPQPPSLVHPFGTDTLGRDLAARTLVGGGISLGVGLAAAIVSVLIGTIWGIVAGYLGRGTDTVMMRLVDVLYGLPYILVVILLLVLFAERTTWVRMVVLFTAIGGVSWLTMARVVRGQVLALRAAEFIQAARAVGAGAPRIIMKELLPNLAGTILICATLTVPLAILQESFLSFLGLGVPPPLASWGTLAADGIEALNPIRTYWWLLAAPCTFLGLTLLGLNFVGDGLRDALDPRAT
ncbi:MAG TPA: ABC transporter permease [Phycisphaerae bacterium]|nr:ABC transporter permease [Phycisphaerae bacterium]